MELPISLTIEVPESLHQSLKSFLDRSPEWDQDRTMTAALSLFMMQNGGPLANGASRVYLNTLFAEVPNAA